MEEKKEKQCSIFDHLESCQFHPKIFQFHKLSKKFIPPTEQQILDFFAILYSRKQKRHYMFRLILTNATIYKYSKNNNKKLKSKIDLNYTRIDKIDKNDKLEDIEKNVNFNDLYLLHKKNNSEKKFGIQLRGYKGLLLLHFTSQNSFNEAYCNLAPLCVQHKITKNYTSGRLLGKGHFAKVSIGFHKITLQQYAIKAVSKDKILNCPRGLIALKNEIDVMKITDHPNVIKLYEIYEGKRNIYLVMEYAEGGELFTFLKSQETYSEGIAAKIMKGFLNGLAHCHSKYIAHRDLKPENLILIDRNNYNIKICDFGLGCFASPGTFLHQKCGSPGYIAPEVFSDRGYGYEVDVYSTGVILYILLSGYTPFFGKSYNEVLQKNMEGEISFKSAIWNCVSNEGKDLCQKMLEKNPSQRISAENALKHHWFKMEFEEMCELNDALENITKYKHNFKISLSKMKEEEKILTRTPLMLGNVEEDKNHSGAFSPRSSSPQKSTFESSNRSSMLVKALKNQFKTSLMETLHKKTPSPIKFKIHDLFNSFAEDPEIRINRDHKSFFSQNENNEPSYIPHNTCNPENLNFSKDSQDSKDLKDLILNKSIDVIISEEQEEFENDASSRLSEIYDEPLIKNVYNFEISTTTKDSLESTSHRRNCIKAMLEEKQENKFKSQFGPKNELVEID